MLLDVWFYINFHFIELGHQLKGGHSFRNCEGQDSNLDAIYAAELGPGTTIMSSMLELFPQAMFRVTSDPYLHAVNLGVMTDFIHSIDYAVSGCGTQIPLTRKSSRNYSASFTSYTCTLSRRKLLLLEGSATYSSFYQWEHMNVGAESYADTTKRPFSVGNQGLPLPVTFPIFTSSPGLSTADSPLREESLLQLAA